MSGMDYSAGSGTNQEMDDQDPFLPGYVPYLSFMLRFIITTVHLLLAAWVVYTIKVTASLHKPHNVFVANLLVSGAITTRLVYLVTVAMMIVFQFEMESTFGCIMFKCLLLPLQVNNLSLMVIAADKVLAITSPFKHRRMMTPRVIAAVISGTWLFSVILTAYGIASVSDGIEVPEYGACIIEEHSLIQFVLAFLLPLATSSVITVILNVQLTIKAYQVLNQIEKKTRLSGQCANVTALKKQLNIKQNRKPNFTLFVILSGGLWITSPAYHDLMKYVIAPNIGFVVRFFHPIIYGLYFKQVREPMMKCLKRFVMVSKVNSVVPQRPRTAWI